MGANSDKNIKCNNRDSLFAKSISRPYSGKLDRHDVNELVMMNLGEILADETPLPKSIIGNGILYENNLLLLSGYRKDGKSMLSLNLAICLASGTDWLGFKVNKPKRVAIVQAEVLQQFTKERLDKMINARGVHVKDENLSVSMPFQGSITNPDIFECLKALIQENKLEVLIIDPLKYYHQSDENSNQEMHKVMSQFRELTFLGTSIIIIHHTGKPSQFAGKRVNPRGASSIADDVDSLIEISKRSDGLKMQFELRYSHSPEDITIKMDSDYWFNLDSDRDVNRQIISLVRNSGSLGILKKDVEKQLSQKLAVSSKTVSNHIMKLVDKEIFKDAKLRNIRLFIEKIRNTEN